MHNKPHTEETKRKCGLKNIGRMPWNKGLHKEDNKSVKKCVDAWSQSQKGKKQSKEFIEKRFIKIIGRKNTQETIKKMKQARLKYYQNNDMPKEVKDKIGKTLCEGIIEGRIKNGRGKCFFRKDLGHLCRSRFEANFCRVQKYLGIAYIYEPQYFTFSNGKKYIPDFYFKEFDFYVELKGYMRKDDEEKIKMFKKEYPEKKLFVLMQGSKTWENIEKKFNKVIPKWE